MTYEDWIIAVAAEAPKLSGSALKLLLHLTSLSIQAGNTVIRLSDRDLESQLHLSRPTLTQAKNALRQIIAIETRPGAASTFNLPADWFPGQRSLFQAPVAKLPSHQWQTKFATGGQETQPPLANFSSRIGQQSWPTGQENRPSLAKNVGQSGQETLPDGQETLPASTWNQHDAPAPSNRIESKSVVIPVQELVVIDRVLDSVEIPPALRADAAVLRDQIHAFMHQFGDRRANQNPPKDELLAKCLAISPLEPLLATLVDLSREHKVRPGSYIWFVVVFLDRLRNVNWKWTKARLDARRERKQPSRESDPGYAADLLGQAVNQVRSIR